MNCCFTGVKQSNGAVALWRMSPRNMFGGSNKNDRVEEYMSTSSPHKGAVTCITHTPAGTYGLLGGPLVFTGSVDHTIKVRQTCNVIPLRSKLLSNDA